MKRILVVQTAFLGDVILTLPLVQVIKKKIPDSSVDFVAIPETVDIIKSHPDVSESLIYDKHGKQRSLLSFLSFRNGLRKKNYDVVLCPHRSLRSCLLTSGSGASVRVGFDNAAIKSSFTDVMPWKFGVHEIDRNLSLLQPVLTIGDQQSAISGESPHIFISEEHRIRADQFLSENKVGQLYAVVAPGTVWATKQYSIIMMAKVVGKLAEKFSKVVLIGGKNDLPLLACFAQLGERVVSAIGKFPIMTSAEIIKRASLLIANDSAPVHIASAFNVPTVSVFGPTVKDFGFYPYHKNSSVAETNSIGCRPCSIHGGRQCPIGTFDCMNRILPDDIIKKASELLEK